MKKLCSMHKIVLTLKFGCDMLIMLGLNYTRHCVAGVIAYLAFFENRGMGIFCVLLSTLFPEGSYMTEKEYGKLVSDMAPKSPLWRDCLNAFWIGGLICTLGQLIMNGFMALEWDKTDAGTGTSMVLIALSALLTGLSLYDNIAKHAGAGTLVPIAGFANSIAAPSVEFKTEGMVLGVGGKMFQIAGPVIVYGVSASVLYGLIYWITTLF